MNTALQKLRDANKNYRFICVGLDTDIEKIPSSLKSSPDPILEFNKRIIDATKDLAAAYKFNLAFYERNGAKGLNTLFQSIKLIPSDILIIGDGKRGDIGNTSKKYAEMLYNEFNFDSVTLNPLMGRDSLEPFLAYDDKLNFILALTSNPSAQDFEKLKLEDNSFLYQEIIKKVKLWNTNNNCGFVFGATNRHELESEINSFDNLPVLLPGIGAQGGSLEEVVKIFKLNNHENYLINLSRALIYKSNGDKFDLMAREELIGINRKICGIYHICPK
mgnify:CR=1 FL=1